MHVSTGDSWLGVKCLKLFCLANLLSLCYYYYYDYLYYYYWYGVATLQIIYLNYNNIMDVVGMWNVFKYNFITILRYNGCYVLIVSIKSLSNHCLGDWHLTQYGIVLRTRMKFDFILFFFFNWYAHDYPLDDEANSELLFIRVICIDYNCHHLCQQTKHHCHCGWTASDCWPLFGLRRNIFSGKMCSRYLLLYWRLAKALVNSFF